MIIPAMMLLLAILACSRPGTQEVIYVTATFPGGERILTESPTPNQPTDTPIKPTPNPTNPQSSAIGSGTYTVQAGDTLAVIAGRAGTTVQAIMTANSMTDPNLLEVGQILVVPDAGGNVVYGPAFKIIPDSELIYSPSAAGFDVTSYVKLKGGFIRAYSTEIGDSIVTAMELVDDVAKNYSVNPRLLLALLEYQGKWLSEPTVSDEAFTYPMGLLEANRTELYPQLLDAADILSAGYYGWKYRGFQSLTFTDGQSIVLNPGLNPGTVGVQYFFSKFSTLAEWQVHVSEGGFFQTYLSMFGDPFRSAFEPMTPANLTQPILNFPFPSGENWYYTGGPHGGYDVGSAWASIDFAPPAPPDELLAAQGYCYISPFRVTAVAPGVIARSGGGFVILDLDGDGNEWTGWTIVYLHMAENDNLAKQGSLVNVGDTIGNPSCTGGFSSATHLHFGRRYNGEWIPIDCYDCPPNVPAVPMVLSGWTVKGYAGQEYQGFMENAGGDFRRAEQGRDDPVNELSW